MLKVILFPRLPFSMTIGVPFQYNVLGAARVMVVFEGGRDRWPSCGGFDKRSVQGFPLVCMYKVIKCFLMP